LNRSPSYLAGAKLGGGAPANLQRRKHMDDDSILLAKIKEFAPQLNARHRARILSQILLLLEAQRQGVEDYPLKSARK